MEKVSKTTDGFEALWGSFTYCFIFSVLLVFTLSLRKLINKCAFSTFIYSNSCNPFSKRENKHSASVDVGIWDKDICIFYFLYFEFLITQFKKDSLNCRNFQTLLKPEVRCLFSVTPETVWALRNDLNGHFSEFCRAENKYITVG